VVRSGSFASKEIVPSLAKYFPSTLDFRKLLLESGVLVEDKEMYRFSQDYALSSPTLAAQIVLCRPANGLTEWKDASGKTLKALQEAEAEK
jgi:hypothetical protein